MTKSEVETSEGGEELLTLLHGDLATLFKLVFTNRKAIAESDVRLASAVLRKWLIDGLLGQLCKSIGVKPTLPTLDNSAALSELSRQPSIDYFLTGGVRFNGEPVSIIYNSSLPVPDRPLLPAAAEILLRLGSFLNQKRIFFAGTFFTCEDIIKFTANKLGGVHYDLERDGKHAKLEEAASFMKFGGPQPFGTPPPSHAYIVLEPEGSEVLTAVHIEIIAAASSLIQLRLDGTPVMELTTKKSLKTQLRERFGKNKVRFKFYPY